MMAIKTSQQKKNEHNNDNVDEETFMKLIKIIIRIYKHKIILDIFILQLYKYIYQLNLHTEM